MRIFIVKIQITAGLCVCLHTGSPGDNTDTLDLADEILEVNGRTLENKTHQEVISYIHQVIYCSFFSLKLSCLGVEIN